MYLHCGPPSTLARDESALTSSPQMCSTYNKKARVNDLENKFEFQQNLHKINITVTNKTLHCKKYNMTGNF